MPDRREETEHDVSDDRKRAECYLELAGVLFIGLDRQGRLDLVNRRACEVLGYTQEELIGADWFAKCLPASMSESVRSVFDGLMRGELVPFEHFDNPVVDSQGEEHIIRWHNTLIRDGSGAIMGTLSSGEDVTEQRRAEEENKRLEAQVLHTQKLESLGVLAGGIAHDFNNILLSILGNAALALQDVPAGSPVRPYLYQIETSSKQAAGLCKQLLAYSGKGRFVVGPLDINAVITEMDQMLRISISRKCTVKLDLAHEVPPMVGDVAQITQVVMNLMTNASDAIGDRSGIISLRTGVMNCDASCLSESFLDDGLVPGQYVFVEVSDTGCGMDDATHARIFDPFFSTKLSGRGLGLATVLGIVRGHLGAIKVRSVPGKGSTFTVLFPVGDTRPESWKLDLSEPVELLSRGSGMVLIVDDDESVLSLGRMILERGGYDVVVARDGREAVETFSRDPAWFVCVVLDLSMPKMDGEETFMALRTLRSDIPVILSSGYDSEEVAERFEGKGLAGFIHKPYRPAELLDMLARILS